MRLALLCALVMVAACSSKAPPPKESRSAEPVVVPAKFQVRFDTTKGPFTVEVTREWSPRATDRFHELVRTKFYDGGRFFRVRPKFVVQFGIAAEPKTQELWRQLKLADDPVKETNARGTI